MVLLVLFSAFLPVCSSRRTGHQCVLWGSDHHAEDQLLSCAVLWLHRGRFGPERSPQWHPVSWLHKQQHLSHRGAVQHKPQHSGGLWQQPGGKEHSSSTIWFKYNQKLQHVACWLVRESKLSEMFLSAGQYSLWDQCLWQHVFGTNWERLRLYWHPWPTHDNQLPSWFVV